MILQQTRDPVDWEKFLTSVQQRQLGFCVGGALRCLHGEFNAPIPARVLEILNRVPPSWLERWEQRIVSRPHGVAGALPLHCVNYLRLMRGQSFGAKISGLPFFFQRTAGVASAWKLPGHYFSRLAARLVPRKKIGKAVGQV